MNVTIKIVHEPLPGPSPVPDSKLPFYITFEVERESLKRLGPWAEQEKEIRDCVQVVFAACKSRLIDYLLEQVKA